jgi:Dimerisation domain
VSAATPQHIMELGLSFWASKTILSAVELGVFGAVADAPADLPTLQRKLALHQRSARDFLDALVALKLLERKKHVYGNTADTDLFLDPSHPNVAAC